MHIGRLVPAPIRSLLRPIRRAFWPDGATPERHPLPTQALLLQDGPVRLAPPPPVIGYLRSRGAYGVSGWIQDTAKPARRVAFQAVIARDGHWEVLAEGVADRHDAELAALGVGDARYGFHLPLPVPIAPEDAGLVEIRPEGLDRVLELPRTPPIGYLRRWDGAVIEGWAFDRADPAQRVHVEAVTEREGSAEVLATTVADRDDAELRALGLGDGRYGFRLVLPEGRCDPRDIKVRPKGWTTGQGMAFGEAAPLPKRPTVESIDAAAAAMAPQTAAAPAVHYLGYVRERSTRHVAGWVHNSAAPGERLEFDVVVAGGARERVIASGLADQFDRVLFALGVGDPVHGFRVLYDAPISEEECDLVEVRVRVTGQVIPLDPNMVTEWKPVRFIAMDIVDNCNLRCPFCLFDHAPVHKTNVMDEDIFERALRWLPYVGPEGLWMSCLHEPSMHPKLPEMIERIPREHRHRMHYTTNLSRRMPDRYYQVLADSGLSNINVSIESRDPEIYERMRKGARHRIFVENWEKLLAAFAKGSAPPPLRYIAMAYKSNFRELPSLIEWLRIERRAWKVEIRDTMDVPWIPQEFRETEFLERPDWVWLRDQLAHYSPNEVTLCLPPDFDVPQPDEGPQHLAQEMPAATPDEPPTTMAPPDAVVPAPHAPDDGSPMAEAELVASDAKLQDLKDDPLFAQKSARLPGLLEGRILHDGLLIISASVAGNYPYHGEVVAQLNIREVDDPDAFIMSLLRAENQSAQP